MRVHSSKYLSIYQFSATQVAAGAGVNWTIPDGAVPPGRLIKRCFLRVRSDLVTTSLSTALSLGTQTVRSALMTGLIASVQATVAKAHPIQTQIVEQMALGDLSRLQADVGIFPTCPQGFGDGQYQGTITPRPRSAVIPAGSNGSHYISIEIPLVDQAFMGAGTSLYLPHDALDGASFTFTVGTLSFTDGAGNTISIPGGTGSTAGVSSYELMIEHVANPDGKPRAAHPAVYRKIPMGTQPQVTLNPNGGAVAAATIRIPSIGGGDDSVDYLVRTQAFTSATSLVEAQEGAFNPQLRIDGRLPSDLAYRGFELFCGLDRINAQSAAVATAHGLRASNLGITKAEGAMYPQSRFYDLGVPLVWNAPDANFFAGLSFGRHDLTIPGAWNSLGSREIYVVLLPDTDAQGSAIVPPSAAVAGARSTKGVFARVLRLLGRQS